jgi:uncharacterized protein YprB with RNaseH-like and TPR domain
VGECLPSDGAAWPRFPWLAGPGADAGGRVLFFDLETTGLAGGAGTYAFLVGMGWFEGSAFEVRQFLLTSAGVERLLLEEAAALASRAGTIVTYNGRSFDMPLIETRFRLHRLRSPLDEVAHLDMLPLARRLWRPGTPTAPWPDDDARRGTCRLTALEAMVLGHLRRDDVPGPEIPARYFHYVRSGDSRPLDAVLEHNRLDLLALAMLTSMAAGLLERGAAAAQTAREALGLAWLFERRGLAGQALACLARAVELPGDAGTRAEALWGYGVACRRAGRFEEAADAWRRLLVMPGCPAWSSRDATEALAVHHEHRLRDFEAARDLAAASLQLATSAARRAGAERRVARLDRRIAKVRQPRVPLFS